MREEPDRLVFLDETATTKMTRLRGRAKRGQRFKAKAPFGHWGTQTFIAALRCDGLIPVPEITDLWSALSGPSDAGRPASAGLGFAGMGPRGRRRDRYQGQKSKLSDPGITAPWIIKGAMNRTLFETYVETQLAPTLRPGDVVILDNLSSHKSEKAKAILKEKGAWFLFLPPLQPRPQPYRDGLRQAQGPSPTHRRPHH
jgi:hypothetical protein